MTISESVQYHHPFRGKHMPDWPSCSVEDAAERTGYHAEHIRRLIREDKIEAIKLGPIYLIKVESLEDYVRAMEATGDGRTGPKGKRK